MTAPDLRARGVGRFAAPVTLGLPGNSVLVATLLLFRWAGHRELTVRDVGRQGWNAQAATRAGCAAAWTSQREYQAAPLPRRSLFSLGGRVENRSRPRAAGARPARERSCRAHRRAPAHPAGGVPGTQEPVSKTPGSRKDGERSPQLRLREASSHREPSEVRTSAARHSCRTDGPDDCGRALA